MSCGAWGCRGCHRNAKSPISHRPHVLPAGHPARSAPPSTSTRSRPPMAVTDCSGPHGSPWRLHLAPWGAVQAPCSPQIPVDGASGRKLSNRKRGTPRAGRVLIAPRTVGVQVRRASGATLEVELYGTTLSVAGQAIGWHAAARHSPHALVDGAHAGSARPLQHTRRAALACSGGEACCQGCPGRRWVSAIGPRAEPRPGGAARRVAGRGHAPPDVCVLALAPHRALAAVPHRRGRPPRLDPSPPATGRNPAPSRSSGRGVSPRPEPVGCRGLARRTAGLGNSWTPNTVYCRSNRAGYYSLTSGYSLKIMSPACDFTGTSWGLTWAGETKRRIILALRPAVHRSRCFHARTWRRRW